MILNVTGALAQALHACAILQSEHPLCFSEANRDETMLAHVAAEGGDKAEMNACDGVCSTGKLLADGHTAASSLLRKVPYKLSVSGPDSQ